MENNRESDNTNVAEFPSVTSEPAPKDNASSHESDATKTAVSEAYKSGYLDGMRRYVNEDDQKRRERWAEFAGALMLITTIGSILWFVAFQNREIFILEPDTLLLISRAFNALVLLTLPFILGSLGAVSRLLLSGVRIPEQFSLVVGSGVMAAFSWIGVKSGVLLALIAPHVEKTRLPDAIEFSKSSSDFYTLALVAIFVGMFSTNLYMFIRDKVEKLAAEKKNQAS